MEQSAPLRTLVFIPAWNEEASIDGVIADVRTHIADADILVIDDGSADSTTERARAAGVLVATMPFNQGLGAALQTGYLWALREGYDCCAHLDADGQHPDQHRGEQRLLVVAEDVDGRGRDQTDRRKRAGQPKPHADPRSIGPRPRNLVAACHEE